MAGEVSANISRSSKDNTEPEPPDRNKSPNFITDETQFVGNGNIRTSTPLNKHRRSRSKSGTRKTPVPLSFSDEHFYEDLEAYVREMSTARTTATMDAGQEHDLWAQLQQKESDLLLAAELGKALLDKNEELKKEQERVTEEYSKKVEVRTMIIFSPPAFTSVTTLCKLFNVLSKSLDLVRLTVYYASFYAIP
ncbi:hypothetical protein B5X24_HaOG210045 [Helicoverpa armigera]|nr:hypothetical protein B5X24_HaOG210045 [Helicoverpa armigera]